MNHGTDRFSVGWIGFVKDHGLKENDNMCFTLCEDDGIATFDIEVNPHN